MRTVAIYGLALSLAVGTIEHAHAAPSRPPAIAEAAFHEGVRLFRAGRFVEALASFDASYRLDPVPEVLFNIAMTQRKLGRFLDALATFDRYGAAIRATPSDATPERAALLEKLIEDVRAQRARVVLPESARGLDATVDGRPMAIAEPTWLDPGRHVIVVRDGARELVRRDVELAAGEVSTVSAEELRAPAATVMVSTTAGSPSRPSHLGRRQVAAIAIGTLGLASLAAAATTGGLSVGVRHDYDAGCDVGNCNAATFAHGRNLSLATDVLIGVGAASAIATLVVLLARRHPGR